MIQRLRVPALAGALAMLATPAAAAEADGAAIYKRCAACHLPDRAGIPGAFPPLKADTKSLAGTDEGRRYLVLVVSKGLFGPITVEGKPYRGMMPAQTGLSDADIAAVLNHISEDGNDKPFTAGEVAQIKAAATALRPADVGALGQKLKRK